MILSSVSQSSRWASAMPAVVSIVRALFACCGAVPAAVITLYSSSYLCGPGVTWRGWRVSRV